MGKLDGKIALVTGAARGIGFGIAEKLAEAGAVTVLSDINGEGAEAAAKRLNDAGFHADFFVADVSKQEAAQKMIETVIQRHGTIHILVNNAGINRDGMLHKISIEAWNEVIAVNLTGVFNCLQAAAIHMREKEYGRIINIASASINGNIGQANYSAAKAGIIGLTKTAAKELGRKKITVNAIVPGFINTEMTRGVPEKVWNIMAQKILLGYVGEPSDVGNAAAFLASDDAKYITSSVIEVTGGMVL